MAINDLASADALRVAGLETKIRNAQAALAADQKALSAPQNQNASAQSILRNAIAQQEEVIADLQAQLAVAQAAVASSQTAAAQPTASAADTTATAQVARDDGANNSATAPAQKIETPEGRIVPKTTAAPTNADVPATAATGSVDLGTNAATVTLNNSQAISSPEPSGPRPAVPTAVVDPAQAARFNQLQGSGAVPGAKPINNATQGGVGAGNDDAAPAVGIGTGTTNSTQNQLSALYGGPNAAIIPQDNILDQYPTYTYSLSWYLLDPTTYGNLILLPNRNLTGYYLLAQSGGAPVQNAVATNGAAATAAGSVQAPGELGRGTVGVGRNPFFPLDYYLDNFEFDSYYSGTPGSRGSSLLSQVTFTVTEPNGISLLKNLYSAVTDVYNTMNIAKPGTPVNYLAAQYCMVVRFYGYDTNGNLIQPIAQRSGVTDRQAAVEKFIPFTITNVDFKVANKLVEYTIKGAGIEQVNNLSTIKGSIPQNFTFNGSTVKDMLVGSVAQTTASTAAGDQTRNGVPISNNSWGEG